MTSVSQRAQRAATARQISAELDRLRGAGAVILDELTPEEQRERLYRSRVFRFVVINPASGFQWPPQKDRSK